MEIDKEKLKKALANIKPYNAAQMCKEHGHFYQSTGWSGTHIFYKCGRCGKNKTEDVMQMTI